MKNFAWLAVLAGIWLIIAPFLLGYTDRRGTTNDILLGIVIIIIALVILSGERISSAK